VPALRLDPSSQIVDEDLICSQGFSESQGSPFTGVERNHMVARRVGQHVQPFRRIANPTLNRSRRPVCL